MVFGQYQTAFKPDPEGLLKLATAWRVQPANMVMVGDYRFDLAAGRAAGTRTVLVHLPENPWPELTDWHAVDCEVLLGMV
jgi:phosphoglycolate phosphatase-like HAD superfamily hydrolase